MAGRDDLIEAYLQAIGLELRQLRDTATLDTLYFGGGTPTHLPPSALARLFAALRERFVLTPQAEVTVEANPLDLDAERVAVLREYGINRISLGVQSFNDAKLAALERDHRRADIQQAIDQARLVTRNLSLDLIFAAPGESLADWLSDIDQAIATGIDHLSVYGLTIEQGSAFYGRWKRGVLVQAAEPLEATMYEEAIDRLAAAGIEQYEVSNFARAGARSRHNQAYWKGKSYFAFGPGAASYLQGRRAINYKSTTTYLKRVLGGESPIAEWEELEPEDRARERLVFGLRMIEGVERREFLEETGYEIEQLVGDQLQPLLSAGLLALSDQRLRLTRRGLLVSDSIWPKFLRR